MRRALIAAAVAAITVGTPALAQEWPQRTVRIVVGFGPGGGADIIGRIVGQALQERLGQAFVIENKPGSAGTLGNELVARAEKDGYTLGIMTAGQIIAATINKGLRYDTLTAFEPVSQLATASLLIVARPDFPANDVKGLIAEAKAKPEKIVFASAGFGATQHLAAELFMQSAGIKMLHVPFRSSPEAIAAVAGRQERFPAVPDVPPAIESGLVPGYDVTTWYGVFGPRGLPPAVVAKLNGAINEILQDQTVRERLKTAGVVVQGSTPAEFGAFMANEFRRWNGVREAAGIPQLER
jgi:tripartite-type tricarboxylate transporter receptor subunit TctC